MTGSSGYVAPRTDAASPCSQSRISVWYTLRKSTLYLRLPLSMVPGERRLLAVQAALDRLADDEERGGGAVVGALAAVLLDAPPELRPGHQNCPVGLAVRGEVLHEGADRGVDLGEQGGLAGDLVLVGVEPADDDVAHLDRGLGDDHLRGELQRRAESCWPPACRPRRRTAPPACMSPRRWRACSSPHSAVLSALSKSAP